MNVKFRMGLLPDVSMLHAACLAPGPDFGLVP